MSLPHTENLELTLFPNGVFEIAFNRPQKYNALSQQTYQEWLDAILWAATAEQVKVVVMIGRGKYYTSGQELSASLNKGDTETKSSKKRSPAIQLVDELIKFPKLLIGAVNGHALGFGVTSLALCDVVYSVPVATFATPFMKLGFCAESCSSVLFPRILGPSRANEMLLMGRSFTAEELEKTGFIGRILPVENFREAVLAIADETTKFAPEAIKVTKDLIRDGDREFLMKVNQEEMDKLAVRLVSPDCIQSISNFQMEAQKKREAKRKQQQSKL